MISAIRRGTVFDRTAVGFSLTFASMQIFFLGPVLLLLLVYNTSILGRPVYVSPTENLGGWFAGMLIPWITLGLINSAQYARLSPRSDARDPLRGLRPYRPRQGTLDPRCPHATRVPGVDHSHRHDRRPRSRRPVGRCGHHRVGLRILRPGAAGDPRRQQPEPADHHGGGHARPRSSSWSPTSSSTCSTPSSTRE